MKIKHNISYMKWIAILVCYCLGISVGIAQTFITNAYTYQNLNIWLEGSNPAGMIYNPYAKFSIAEAVYDFTQGNFRLATTAPSIHQYRIYSESYRQWNKIQLYGQLGYTGIHQKQRQWNATLEPEAHLISFGDTIKGNQHNETYHLSGGIAIPLTSNWNIGGKLNYNAHSNTKDTDPRNSNKQTDLYFSPGILFSREQFKVGANFIYQRLREVVSYSIVNIRQQEGRTFYPLWFYVNENFQQGANNTRTYVEERYGSALQLFLGNRKTEWMNEFRYSQGTENTEIMESKGIRAGETERREFIYTGILRLQKQLRHSLKPQYQYLERTSFECIQAIPEGSSENYMHTYERVKRSAIMLHKAALTYKLERMQDSLITAWSFYARYEYRQERTFFIVYPSRFEEPTTQMTFTLGYNQRLNIHKQVMEIGGHFSYITGYGTLPENKLTSGQTIFPEINISQKQDLLLHDFQIKTAEALQIQLNLQYTCPITSKLALSCTAKGNYLHCISLSGYKRFNLSFSSGFIF